MGVEDIETLVAETVRGNEETWQHLDGTFWKVGKGLKVPRACAPVGRPARRAAPTDPVPNASAARWVGTATTMSR